MVTLVVVSFSVAVVCIATTFPPLAAAAVLLVPDPPGTAIAVLVVAATSVSLAAAEWLCCTIPPPGKGATVEDNVVTGWWESDILGLTVNKRSERFQKNKNGNLTANQESGRLLFQESTYLHLLI